MQVLRSLALDDTNVTDAGLAHLKELRGVEYLYLTGAKVTDAGIADLKTALPKMEVYK